VSQAARSAPRFIRHHPEVPLQPEYVPYVIAGSRRLVLREAPGRGVDVEVDVRIVGEPAKDDDPAPPDRAAQKLGRGDLRRGTPGSETPANGS